MTQATATAFKSPLHKMTQTTPTCLWNDSASIEELKYSMEHGGVGATCNPVIVLGVLKKELGEWKKRIEVLLFGQSAAVKWTCACSPVDWEWHRVKCMCLARSTLLARSTRVSDYASWSNGFGRAVSTGWMLESFTTLAHFAISPRM